MHEGSRHQNMIDRGLSKRFLDRLDATLLHPGGMSHLPRRPAHLISRARTECAVSDEGMHYWEKDAQGEF